ncbi:hypothetical protein PIB30_072338 [Stylosanthes scabra]|uniref:NB-ARC domain-containing protein n=1 Tax=Stylosanthes scabra TaxID=79078 RepID=A0ABU6YQV7_9FABA|nr:hypothetical protein [Stylosanthes scabra]
MGCLLESIASEFISKLRDWVVKPTVMQFQYLICHEKLVGNLKKEHKKLEDMKNAIQGKVLADRSSGLQIADNVQPWLSGVEAIDAEVQKLLEDAEQNEHKKCFGGLCPDLAENYSLGKQATRKSQHIAGLVEGRRELGPISYPKPVPRVGSTFTQEIMGFESRNKIIGDVVEKLKDDKIKRMSICGMGGVGKTTLVKGVIKVVESQKLFDKVVMAVVSQTPNYEKIQNEIAGFLGLHFQSMGERSRAGELVQRLKEIERVLIVLDDVWKDDLDFEMIGIPVSGLEKICKIVFTSRDEDMCSRMGSQKNVVVPFLSEVEAWDLFRDMAGSETVDKANINSIAREVAKECGGLPLAIVTVAGVMQNKAKPQWQNRLVELKHSQLPNKMHLSIEFSLESLRTEEHKYCLFLCALFPEDFDVPIESVLRHAVGMQLIVFTGALVNARNKVDTLVDDLKRCFLLLESEKVGCVKMHDVVRDVVLSIASREEHGFVVQQGCDELKQLKKQDKAVHFRALSLILQDAITDGKEFQNGLRCPMLELFQARSEIEEAILWPEDFLQGMRKIRVLTMNKLNIPVMFSLFQTSVNLSTLQLEHCDVGDVSVIGILVALEILSFSGSNIKELPAEIGQLSSLKLLDLTGCEELVFISDNVFAGLTQLEELYFRVENFPWMLNETVLGELRELCQHLKVFEIQVREVEILPKDLGFNNLERFWIYVASSYNHWEDARVGYVEPNTLVLRGTSYNKCMKGSSVVMQLKRCEVLRLGRVKELKNVMSELDDSGFQCLTYLKLDSCPDVEYVVDRMSAFPLLKSLSIQYLPKLREICKASHNDSELNNSFSNLEELYLYSLLIFTGFSNAMDSSEAAPSSSHHGSSERVEGTQSVEEESMSKSNCDASCHNKLFSSFWMLKFPRLESITLMKCHSLEEVFDMQEYSKSSNSQMFPHLRDITIEFLPKLKYVWGNVPRIVDGFHNLKSIDILGCHSLRHVFTPATVRAMVNLETVQIRYCKSMVALVLDEETSGREQTIIFNKLSSLSLSRLPNLGNLYTDSAKLQCPSLITFSFYKCPKLKVSLIPTQLKIQNNECRNSKEKKLSSSFHRPNIGCMPWPLKFIGQRSQDNTTSMDASMAQHQQLAISEIKGKAETSHLPVLEHLHLEDCDLVEEVVLIEESHDSSLDICDNDKLEKRTSMMVTFSQMVSLELINLPNLENFCSFAIKKQHGRDSNEGSERIRGNPFINGLFVPHLTSLNMSGCDKIKTLFSFSTFENLHSLEVSDCKNIEEIVSKEKINTSANQVMFPKLETLNLESLPMLKAFCQASYAFELPSLQDVTIKDCLNMEAFSRGSCHTNMLKNITMNSKATYFKCDIFMQKRDQLNATVEGFKTFMALHEEKMIRWSHLHDKGISKNLFEISDMKEMHMFPHVRELSIKACDSLQEVFESRGGVLTKEGYDQNINNYELQSIELEDLPKVRSIWGPNIIRHASFGKLTSIEIAGCNNLKCVVPYSVAKSLVEIKELKVKNCEMIQEIVKKEEEEKNINMDGACKDETLFPKLENLSLEGLPNMRCVCYGDYGYDIPLRNEDEEDQKQQQVQISFPQLKELNLSDVPNLQCFCGGSYDYDTMLLLPSSQINGMGKVIVSTPKLHKVNNEMLTLGDVNLTLYYLLSYSDKYKVELQEVETFEGIDEKPQYKHLVAYMSRVTSLQLENCNKLLKCVPSNTIHSLLFQHLEQLHVQQCQIMEVVFEGNSTGIDKSELERMELRSLPKLKHIWRNNNSVIKGFENLTYLIISGCHDLKFVFADESVARSLPNLEELEVDECEEMEEIIENNNNNKIVKQKVAKIIFPSLGSIKLKKLSKLKWFCSISSVCFELPRCKCIEIKECPKMESFCHAPLYTPWLSTIKVDEAECDRHEEVNETIRQRHRKFS